MSYYRAGKLMEEDWETERETRRQLEAERQSKLHPKYQELSELDRAQSQILAIREHLNALEKTIQKLDKAIAKDNV